MSTETLPKGALSQVLIGRSSLAADVALVIGGATLTAISAQISIPTWPVPFTLTTLAVMLCGLTLGMRRGIASQVAYLASGVAGLPVFAHGTSGFLKLIGPTGGYLIAFVLAAGLLGWFADRGWDRSVPRLALALLATNVVVFLLGASWLAFYMGWSGAITTGVLPFLPGDFLKSIVAVLSMPLAWRLVSSKLSA